MLIFFTINFFRPFPVINYTDPPFNWEKVVWLLSQKSKKNEIILISSQPSYMYEPIKYYSQFWPINGTYFFEANSQTVKKLKNNRAYCFFIKINWELSDSQEDDELLFTELGCDQTNINDDSYIHLYKCCR